MKDTRDRFDSEVVAKAVARLPDIAAQWATLEPEDRIGFRAEWDNLIDVYVGLVDASDAGRLPADLQASLLAVSGRLEELTAVLERLRLRKPDPSVLARLRLAAAN